MYPTQHWSQQDGMTSSGSHSTGATDPNTAAVIQATPAQEAAVPGPSTSHGAAPPNAAYPQQYLDAQRAHYEGSEGTTSRAVPYRHSVSRYAHPGQGGKAYLEPQRTRPIVRPYADLPLLVALDRPLESMTHAYTP
jgi:hypothetical protein